MGLKGATLHYACAWCKLHEDDHWNMEFELNYYQFNRSDEGLTLETSAFLLFTVANLRFQPSC